MNARRSARRRPVLILGGTSEARVIAASLDGHGYPVISSLAGRVRDPALPVGEVRVGGFGGPDGLEAWLCEHDVAAVVDATHPFAARISASAVTATRAVGLPLLRVERPGWRPADGDEWHWADSIDDAARLVGEMGSRVFLTTGRQGLSAFGDVGAVWFLARCVDAPDPPLPPRCEVLLARGPYTVEGEAELMRRHRIDLLVTKDSGGSLTSAKLTAARLLGIPVVVVRRPLRPAADTVASAEEAVRWALTMIDDDALQES